MEVTCAVDSEPLASVLWYRAGSGHIMSRQPLLRLDQVTREQAGEYVCSANNSVGTSQPDSVDIVVQCKCSHFAHKDIYARTPDNLIFSFSPSRVSSRVAPREIKIKFLNIFPWFLG